ncbi:hypothetical protein PENSOL_c042G10620 [Penicillium solitum]|uniref:Nucleoside phosphorylase domain-containing protein n=1 Tax=Penicillium solitum TaxID=60172 RepID=A0A1V6QT02_9EURO|nr:uncharacterized protein PENSOL_c042G10620 [Penicillium solitum]OQD92345.1 hypothetical protein PENSOL_c042G10620 [Penicillium solitum]
MEADAVEALFDETYDRFSRLYGKQPGDTNAYVNGRMDKHNVVLCYMPGMGKESAASVASTLRFSYTEIQLALVVGICGGAPSPSPSRQIYLGDVVISDSVIAYDFGRQYPGGFRRKRDVKDTLGRPNQEIRTLLAGLNASRSQIEFRQQMLVNLHSLQQKETRWQHPGFEDILFDASYLHKHHALSPHSRCGCSTDNLPYDICDEALEIECYDLKCDKNQIVRRRSGTPILGEASVHIGKVASADTVMKSGEHRDAITREERVLGFEMEAAGVWENIACIIVKGVCDYADSHKSKVWQCYAAATGASAAMAFLGYWRPAGKDGIIDDEIESLRWMSLSDPANDENAQRQRTARENKSKANFYRLWEGQKHTLREDYKDMLLSLHLRGVALYEQAKYAEAEDIHRQVWEGRKQTLGEDHKDTLLSLHWIGMALDNQAKYAEAEHTHRQVWEGRKQTFGKYHEYTFASLYLRGMAFYKQARYAEAEDTHRQTWEGQKQTLGEGHRATLLSRYWLGQALYDQEKYTLAAEAYRDAWEGRKRALSENHEDTLSSLYWLGLALKKQAKYAETEVAFYRLWEGQKQTIGEYHKDTLSSLHRLGQTLYYQEKYALAAETYRDAWKGRKRALGENHAKTLLSLNQMRNALSKSSASAKKRKPR